ncbi:energy-coupling factor transporter transmembrane protein EcfT [Stappia stellulata]|uniref:energy-coupling factor transporter transmembrane component T family protein n=1 Tax=Stappia stellulata TaxID=71235 RepID=UPI001CD2A004|nr:energy-coupling factor transporter transmembrane protein EcfT [Stappia stellulata]MCA1244252.1 energy-coupling factor transporter transmembrane protein EcfT [Stappia stellulata]
MLTDLYVFADSPVHRARPVVKIAALVVLCTSLFVCEGWTAVTVAGVLVFTGFALAGLGPRHAIVSVRPALWILAAIFAVQLYMTDVVFAGFIVARFVVLILAAALVTLTTRTSEFVDGILSALRFAPAWVPKAQIALAVSLFLRFVPLVRTALDDVREAQRARGLDRNIKAILVPLVVRILKTADEVSQAIYARSFD